MKALKVAKLDGTSKEERKALRKKIRSELKAQGFEKEEIKKIIKENIKIDKEKKIVLLQERGEDVSDLVGVEDDAAAALMGDDDSPTDAFDEDNPDFYKYYLTIREGHLQRPLWSSNYPYLHLRRK